MLETYYECTEMDLMASRVYIQKAMFISMGLFLLQAGEYRRVGYLPSSQPRWKLRMRVVLQPMCYVRW